MSLFIRLLTLLYPDSLIAQPGSPAAMFLGMISPQNFFNIITKKMAENYRTNRFDLSLDPFEVKIGFGEQSMIKPKAMQSYYSYCVAANLNGYQSFMVGSVATMMTIMASNYLRPLVHSSQKYWYLTQLLHSLFVLAHVFAARIKVFPEQDSNHTYQRFLDLWFAYYDMLLETNKKRQPYDPKIVNTIKSRIKANIELCFTLYRMMRHYSRMMTSFSDRTFFKWLLGKDVAVNDSMNNNEIIDHIIARSHIADFDAIEYAIIHDIIPHEFNIHYFFGQQEAFAMIDYVVSELFDYTKIDEYMIKCLDSDQAALDLIRYLSDYKHIKDNFFQATKDFIIHEVRDEEQEEEVEEFMSLIGSGMMGNIPDTLRKESQITERLMNFYLNYVGGLRSARGDTGTLMLYSQFSQYISSYIHETQVSEQEMKLYRHYINQYATNAGYYQHVFQGVRSGKASFTLPYIIDDDGIYSGSSLISLIIQSSLTSTLQDCTYKEIKLYPQASKMIEVFKELFFQEISLLLQGDKAQLIRYVIPHADDKLVDMIDASDTHMTNLRESLYTIDLHCYHVILTTIMQHFAYQQHHSTGSTILIASTLRETVYGLLCLMAMLEVQTKYSGSKSQDMIQFLLSSYVINIMGLQDTATMVVCFDAIYDFYKRVAPLLKEIVKLDNNEEFMMMGIEFMYRFLKDKDDPIQAHVSLLKEDVIWLRGYLKHINYYNKRYFIPQN